MEQDMHHSMDKQHVHKMAQQHHAHHIGEFKKRFWISLVFTIPILLLSEMIQMWLGFKLEIPFQKWILFSLSSLVYFYGGWPFLKGGIRELKNRQPGMMTLISAAISVAYFYSIAVLLLPGLTVQAVAEVGLAAFAWLFFHR